MMLFQRNTEYVRNFQVSTSSSSIAYGPGSIINGLSIFEHERKKGNY